MAKEKLAANESAAHAEHRAHADTSSALYAATHNIVGYDSFTGNFNPQSKRAVIQAAFSFKGGIIVVRAHLVGDSRKFTGRILHGTGVYSGIEGTVSGREGSHNRTFLTMTYTL